MNYLNLGHRVSRLVVSMSLLRGFQNAVKKICLFFSAQTENKNKGAKEVGARTTWQNARRQRNRRFKIKATMKIDTILFGFCVSHAKRITLNNSQTNARTKKEVDKKLRAMNHLVQKESKKEFMTKANKFDSNAVWFGAAPQCDTKKTAHVSCVRASAWQCADFNFLYLASGIKPKSDDLQRKGLLYCYWNTIRF